MRIALFSDSHDRLDTLHEAVAQFPALEIETGFHLGDHCSLPILEALSATGIPWHCVPGNNDRLLLQTRPSLENVTFLFTDTHELTVGKRTLFLTHYPEIARMAALSGRYDAAFHGHTHRKAAEYIQTPHKKALLANPGELCGLRYGEASFGVYDTETNTIRHQVLTGSSAA